MKKNILSFFLCLAYTFVVDAKSNDSLLNQADLLFSDQKFTQSFKLYDSIYKLKMSTPSMLLKMAYIKEGLGDVTFAQYYLNEYYLATNNIQALEKMEELAAKEGLTGFEIDDNDNMINLYYKWVIIGILLVSITLFLVFIFRLKKYKRQSPVLNFSLITTLIILFILLNFWKSYSKALVIKRNTLVMLAPSAGADLIGIIKKGSRINIKNKKDVWLEIDWEGKTAYIKNKNAKKLNSW